MCLVWPGADDQGVPCSFRVLDECDEMLNMGFVEDVEKILSGGSSDKVQTMLFSATLPSWVKSITARFLNKSHKTVDLVGTEKIKVRGIGGTDQTLYPRP